ncbi:MAG: ATP-binding cassette domain-containing protein [Bacteroidota bacterium]
MYDSTNGTITIDGKNIKDIDLHSFREQVSYVPQDVFLFSDTISNNIRFGLRQDSHVNVAEAARYASVDREIDRFSGKYETIVGERGVTLSGGQKQRISIARALIKDPGLVIFDDCLSAVDAKTEREIISSLYNYLEGKTAIIITHRIFRFLILIRSWYLKMVKSLKPVTTLHFWPAMVTMQNCMPASRNRKRIVKIRAARFHFLFTGKFGSVKNIFIFVNSETKSII